ncbi:hypothetical protein BHU72_10965 [Desulfuribacillus stibiiarsenatis]|uniref:DUF3267 domain-containing protein n=1 Tax=Desulfuribacillus stibiiarsenatis TaxID=1390249 RepID=A0A1E5L2D5_9FIRM|nr:metalloprotease family protein [Desulfuribacillus stibiiarsenatis]OEH84318.1 hypothetical protein BHU72_10965 [Desulfuribacillus stibiiarsenatis]
MLDHEDSTLYNYKLIYHTKLSPKVKIALSFVMLIILGLSSFSLFQLYTFYPIAPIQSIEIFLQILFGILFAPILHALCHALGYLVIGTYPKLQMLAPLGISTPKFCTDSLVIKRNFIFMLLTPLLLGSGLLLLFMAFSSMFWYAYATMLALHVSFTIPDLYWVWNVRSMHSGVMFRSSKHGFNVYKI